MASGTLKLPYFNGIWDPKTTNSQSSLVTMKTTNSQSSLVTMKTIFWTQETPSFGHRKNPLLDTGKHTLFSDFSGSIRFLAGFTKEVSKMCPKCVQKVVFLCYFMVHF